jgi:hypothetical protein
MPAKNSKINSIRKSGKQEFHAVFSPAFPTIQNSKAISERTTDFTDGHG